MAELHVNKKKVLEQPIVVAGDYRFRKTPRCPTTPISRHSFICWILMESISVSVRDKDDNVPIEFLPKFCGTYMGEIMVNGALIASVPIPRQKVNLKLERSPCIRSNPS